MAILGSLIADNEARATFVSGNDHDGLPHAIRKLRADEYRYDAASLRIALDILCQHGDTP